MISTINERLDTINNEIKTIAAELDRLRDLKDKCCSHRIYIYNIYILFMGEHTTGLLGSTTQKVTFKCILRKGY